MVFSVREVRAFLAFCEGAECNPVTLYFHEGGRPVLFVYEDQGAGGAGGADFGMPGGSEGVQSVELVLATMEPALTADAVRAPAHAHAHATAANGSNGGGGGRRRVGPQAAAAAASVKAEKGREEEGSGEDGADGSTQGE